MLLLNLLNNITRLQSDLNLNGGLSFVADGFGLLFLVVEIFYVIFAALIIRQVTLLSATLKTPHAGLFRVIAIVHFFAALGVLIFSYLLL
jgi:hypothetical protein